jgi:transcriptional regulator with XRE-family HTH domain
MRRLHLKLFYLRTRYKREPQGVTARLLGVRPATMSHLEQGRSLPTLPMLMALSRHYDVTPTYLLDDDRPIEPGARDRWSERNALIARGHWLEVPDGAAIRTNDGVLLCPVMSGSRFYDSTAQAERILCANKDAADSLGATISEGEAAQDRELEEILSRELLSQRKPRNKGNGVAKGTKSAPSAPATDVVDGGLAAEA